MWIDTKLQSSPLKRRLRRLSTGERREEAVEFIRRFHHENELSEEVCRLREKSVIRSLKATGHYDHTPEELAFGARIAWRNHARCIGRLVWQSLEVIDCRAITDPDQIAASLTKHVGDAFSGGKIKPTISIFPPQVGDFSPAYIESGQLIEYAGYVADGGAIGDRANIEKTRVAQSMGWMPPAQQGMFDVLPLMIKDKAGRRKLYEVPTTAFREVSITHPNYPGIGELGLRWYAVPCVTNMILTIGGIDYPCAPFSGYYMATEIASRDFADENRYDLLSSVGTAMGLDCAADAPSLWKDRAMLELNEAVLHSFRTAGVRIVDHHTASEQYLEFGRRERAAGRHASGEWSWIVPPQAGGACPVFHLPMTNNNAVPNFYVSRAADGADLRQTYDDKSQSRAEIRLREARHRFRNWRRRKG